jgi:N-acetylglutamate synthase-like GNAT family acetyltransferase
MEIRDYQSSDFEACLRLFDSNAPEHFAPGERCAFEAFLAAPTGTYYVMENDGELLGCGGFARENDPALVSLTWGLIRRDLHRQGLGRFLLFYRLREIGKLPGVNSVRLSTTTRSQGFFERAGGFRVAAVEQDRVEMVKRLAVCA